MLGVLVFDWLVELGSLPNQDADDLGVCRQLEWAGLLPNPVALPTDLLLTLAAVKE